MKFSEKVLNIAQEISDGCQGGLPAYCVTSCPMHTDAKGYIDLIHQGKLEDSLKIIRDKLFLPGTLGRICSHPCEVNCRRNTDYKQPISIASLKRYVADKVDNVSLWDCSKKPNTGKTVAVIGAGPAGAQASIDLAKEGHKVTIYEKLPVVGGMMRVGIPEYRLPRNIIDFEYKFLEKLGIDIKFNIEIGKDIKFKQLQIDYDAIVIANGASIGILPKIDGIKSNGVLTAVDFLKEVSLSSKSSVLGKKVVVIGGGDVAMDSARTAQRLGVDKVELVYRRSEQEMPSSKEEIEHTKEEGVSFNCNLNCISIKEEQGRIVEITCVETEYKTNEKGQKELVDTQNIKTIKCDTVVYAIGQRVEDITNGIIANKFDKDTLQTSEKNIFVAGDCAGSSIVVEAMALGRKAAISVINYLNNKDCLYQRNLEEEYGYKSKLEIPTIENTQKRNSTQMIDPKIRIQNFDECDLGFTDETALKESNRCMQCECKLCMKECIMMNDFVTYPKEFTDRVPQGELSELMTYSCNMCDQCTIVCPKGYKFAEFFGSARKDMCKLNGGNSPIKGHSAINMHQILGFSSIFCTKVKSKRKG